MKLYSYRTILIYLVCAQFIGCLALNDNTGGMKSDDDGAMSLLQSGISSLRDNQLDLAITDFNLSLSLAISAEAIDGLGCVAFRNAISLLRDGNSIDSLKNLMIAEKYFSYALKVNPDYYVAYGHLALVNEALGDIELAKSYFEKAISLMPRDFKVRNNFAVLLRDSGQLSVASSVYSDSIELKNVFEGGD